MDRSTKPAVNGAVNRAPAVSCESVIVRDPLFPSSSVFREKRMQSRVGQGPAGVLLLRRPFLAPSQPSWLQRAAVDRTRESTAGPAPPPPVVLVRRHGRRGPCRRAIPARSVAVRRKGKQQRRAGPPTSEQRSTQHRKSETTHPPASFWPTELSPL
jgi:hypothetical protein